MVWDVLEQVKHYRGVVCAVNSGNKGAGSRILDGKNPVKSGTGSGNCPRTVNESKRECFWEF